MNFVPLLVVKDFVVGSLMEFPLECFVISFQTMLSSESILMSFVLLSAADTGITIDAIKINSIRITHNRFICASSLSG